MKRIPILILEHLLQEITPAIRTELANLLDDLELKAKQTPNKFDDLFVKLLKWLLLGVDY